MPTRLIRSLYNLPPKARGSVMTIGNFDGAHLGHQALLAEVVTRAKKQGVPSLVMTFEPHPFEFFAGENLTIPRITRLREKFVRLSESQVDHVLVLPFNQSLAQVSASDFTNEIIGKALKPVHIVIGDDFHFGYKRQGNLALLQEKGAALGFSVSAMPSLLVEGERVSSTRVRKALGEGDLTLAAQLLGHPYSMLGRVRQGDKRGRQFGFPTANIYLHRQLTPIRGVYTVYVHGVADHPWPGVANIGTRPTIDGTRTLLEVHLLDFHQEIYGRYVEVEFCEKLRDEARYPTIDLLKEQIAKDVLAARTYFS